MSYYISKKKRAFNFYKSDNGGRYPIVSAKDEGLEEWFKQHPDVTGMAIGAGLNGIDGPRRIVRNPYSNIITDPDDPRWESLDKIEAIRHYMDETKYVPKFQLSPQQQKYRKTVLKGLPYETDDNAFKQSIISRIAVNDTLDLGITPEQQIEYNTFIKRFNRK